MTPRGYQHYGTRFLIEHKRAMIADPPGLGKTLQASDAAAEVGFPSLIVTPGYVTTQWAEFLQKQYPGTKVSLAQGTSTYKAQALSVAADWYIINTEMMRNPPILRANPRSLILDESHRFKGRKAKQSTATFTYARTVPYVFELSGTPIQREADDLYMQFKILDPPSFTSYWNFVDEYCKHHSDQYGTHIFGVKDPVALRTLFARYAIRRTYEEVDLELPELIETILDVDFTPEERKAYNQVRESYRMEADAAADAGIFFTGAAQAVQALRIITANSTAKLAAVKELVEDLNVPCIVFCKYRDTAHTLGTLLNAKVITGEVPAAKRGAIARTSSRVVATIASLTEGVDLSHLTLVIFYEEEHVPGRQYQALSRVRRWSDKGPEHLLPMERLRPAVVYYIHVRASIDKVVRRVVMRRINSTNEFITEAFV